MKEHTGNCLNDAQKILVAFGAAMGSGCRKCAEKIHKMGQGQGITEEEMLKSCQIGLDAKAEVITAMRAKVTEMLKKISQKENKCCEKDMDKLAALIRTAAFAAANSSPDVIKEVSKAFAQGIHKGDIKICLSIAKMVRDKASAFSDQEVSDRTGCSADSDKMSNVCASDSSDCTCE